MTAPVATIADAVVVGSIVSSIWNLNTSHGIWIEIVIDMQAIDIITGDDIPDDVTDIVTAGLEGRIEQCQTIVLESPLRMLHNNMIAGIGMSYLRLGTIRVYPGMQFHTATVTLVNHPLQGIPIGSRSPTLLCCEIIAPGLQLTLIEGITLRTYLENDGITAIFLQLVKLIGQRALHLFGTHALKLSIDTLNPGTTELSLRLCLNARSHEH